ncbi:MAG: DUF1461 domain-containing protein [bacterium]|nr:DUF1461 domain-containing protein [bacterium]
MLNKWALAILLLISLTLFNTFLLISIFKLFPTLLIANNTYIFEHNQILDLVIYGQAKNNISKNISIDELSHIKDVHNIVILTLIIFILTTSIIATIIKKINPKVLNDSLSTSIYLIIASIILLLLFFNQLFVKFHQAIFPQGNWSFSENSVLIQLYPEGFWVTASTIILVLSIIELIFLKKHKRFTSSNKPLTI